MKKKSRLKSVNEGRIVKNILRMRKKIKGDMKLRMVLESVEDMEGVYVNRGLIGSRLEKMGWVKNVDGIDVLVEKKVKMVNRDK